MSESNSESTVECDVWFCEGIILQLEQAIEFLRSDLNESKNQLKEMKLKLGNIDALEQKLNKTTECCYRLIDYLRTVDKILKRFVLFVQFTMFFTLSVFVFGVMTVVFYFTLYTKRT
jgi:CII-binding regulator of phage lambda lysogenization HflD